MFIQIKSCLYLVFVLHETVKTALAFKAVVVMVFCFFLLLLLFSQSGRLNVNNVCESINNSIKSLNGELNCSALLWEKRQSKCFATCSPPILKTIFSYFKIYSPGFPCSCLVGNL